MDELEKLQGTAQQMGQAIEDVVQRALEQHAAAQDAYSAAIQAGGHALMEEVRMLSEISETFYRQTVRLGFDHAEFTGHVQRVRNGN